MKWVRFFPFLVLLCIFIFHGCTQKENKNKNQILSKGDVALQPPQSDRLWIITMDAILLNAPRADAQKIGEVHRDDYARVLDIHESMSANNSDEQVPLKWYKIILLKNEKIGWVNGDAIELIRHSPHWSADTKEFDEIAKIIYQDKFFYDKPVVHVSIDSKRYRVILWCDRYATVTQDVAKNILTYLDMTLYPEQCKKPESEFSPLCTKDWKEKGNWIYVGIDNQGPYRILRPFGGSSFEIF